MTGIERLHEVVRELGRFSFCYDLYETLGNIADQIERERACDSDTAENIRLIVGGVIDDMERHVSGVEGADDSPVARWARELRRALKSDTSDGRGAQNPSWHDHAEAADVTSDAPKVTRDPADDVSMSAYDLLPQEDREAIAWVSEHGGLDAVKKLLDWVVGHCSTRQQLDFDFWLSGRVMHELGFDEDMADRDEVERRLLARLMPEDMEWPRFESGEPVRIGDVVSDVEVRSVVFRDGGILLSDCTSVPGWGTWRSYKEPIKRSAPKVLDADGAEIRVGDKCYVASNGDGPYVVDYIRETDGAIDMQWHKNENDSLHVRPDLITHRAPVLAADGRPLEVGQTVWDENGDELVIGALEDGGHTVSCRYADVGDAIPVHGMWSPSDLTHERPDSWERLEDDADALLKAESNGKGSYNAANDYCNAHGLGTDGTVWVLVAQDLVRRAKALAGDA